MLRDDELRGRLADLGVVSEGAARDPARFRDDLIAVLREVGPRVRGLRDDPAVQELVQDPEVVAMVHAGDTMGLLAHPGFRSLVERVAAQPRLLELGQLALPTGVRGGIACSPGGGGACRAVPRS